MEPDVIQLHSSPPPLVENGDDELGSEEEGLGDFQGFPHFSTCSPQGLASSTDSPSTLRQSSPTLKPANHQPKRNFHRPVKKSQPASTVNSRSGNSMLILGGKDYKNSYVHVSNGYPESGHNSGTHSVSTVLVNAHREETGFADFTVFTEQPEHPWCCGFTPSGDTERPSARLREQSSEPEHEVTKESEPRHHSTYQVKERLCTMVHHCEKREEASVPSAQDNQPLQEIAAGFDFLPDGPKLWKGKSGKSGQSCSSLDKDVQKEEMSNREDQEERAWTVKLPFDEHECASVGLESFCDDLSIEGPSGDWEPNVSSLASEDQTDWDQSDDEEEELGNDCNYDSINYESKADLRRSKAENVLRYCHHQSATQETSATSNHTQPGTHADNCSDFRDCSLEPHGERGDVQTADARMQTPQTLPPSDSFSDFCSAPMQEDEEELWSEFNDQKRGRTGELVGSLQTDATPEEDLYSVQSETSRRSSSQASLPSHLQQLLLASFPEVEIPFEDEEEVLTLRALEEVQPGFTCQWAQQGVWRPHQDLHAALGLQFQWGGSHTNTTLLRCLGVDPKNIGKLEPSLKTVSSSGDTPTVSADSMQETLSSSRLDWSSHGLSSSQDGASSGRASHFWGGLE